MTVYKKQLELQSKGKIPSYIDITEQVKEAVAESNIKNGIISVVSPHTTCAVFYEEYSHDRDENGDDTLQQELNRALTKIIPYHDSKDTYIYPGEEHYQVVESWPNADDYLPGGNRSALWNGDAHLKATVIGSSEVFDLSNGKLTVGSTGYIYFVDFDRTRSRKRKCLITIIGEQLLSKKVKKIPATIGKYSKVGRDF